MYFPSVLALGLIRWPRVLTSVQVCLASTKSRAGHKGPTRLLRSNTVRSATTQRAISVLRLRESDEYGLEGRVYRAGKSCTDLQVGKGRVQHFTGAQTRKTGKMISTMAQLKNCCLGGVRDRQEGEEKQRQFEVLSFPLFSLFLILTNMVYL